MRRKTIYTLNIGDYAPEVTELTYPFLQLYADKIGAAVHVINSRRYPEYPLMYEKMQIYDLAQQHGNDWNIYIDSDAFINPDLFDVTTYMDTDTVLHNCHHHAGQRWYLDRNFERDYRFIGCYDWIVIGSAQCIELWKPLDDLTLEEALSQIVTTCLHWQWKVRPEHLIAEFVISRNVAKYGLHYTTLYKIQQAIGDEGDYYWHKFTISDSEKRRQLCQAIKEAGCIDFLPSHLRDGVHRTKLDGAHKKPPIYDLSPDHVMVKGKAAYASHL